MGRGIFFQRRGEGGGSDRLRRVDVLEDYQYCIVDLS
jgi:hypothetical protein